MDRRGFLKAVAGGATAAACGLAYAKAEADDEPITMEVWHEASTVDMSPFRATLQAKYDGVWYDVICSRGGLMDTTEWYLNGERVWSAAYGLAYQDDGTTEVPDGTQSRVVRLQLSLRYRAPEEISGVEVFT